MGIKHVGKHGISRINTGVIRWTRKYHVFERFVLVVSADSWDFPGPWGPDIGNLRNSTSENVR
jgi:hypothetical protein